MNSVQLNKTRITLVGHENGVCNEIN